MKPLSMYVKQRSELIEQMFHSINHKKLKGMLPDILKVRIKQCSLRYTGELRGDAGHIENTIRVKIHLLSQNMYTPW